MRSFKRWLAVSLLVLLLMGWMGSRSVGLAAGKVKLDFTENTTYTIAESGKFITVKSVITIVNRDPSTRKKRGGGYYYYDRIVWALPKGVANVKAIRGDGKKLKIRRKKKTTEYDFYTIWLRRRLTYKQKVVIKLSYDIKKAQPPFYVSENVASIPAFTIENRSWVAQGRVVVDFPDDFTVEVDEDGCTIQPQKARVVCSEGFTSQPAGDFFVIEGQSDAEEKELVSDLIPMQEQDIRIRVRYLEGEEAWANKVVNVLSQALPVLEEVMGFPYEGSGEIEVIRSTTGETYGYAGGYEDDDTVRILPNASRATIVHEGAHLWSWPFASVWLSEGWAEWAARETIRRLKMNPEEGEYQLPGRDKLKMPLESWEHVGLESDEDADIEQYGYAKSYDTIKRLVKLVGLERLQEVNARFAELNKDDDALQATGYAYLEALLQQPNKKKQAQRLIKLWKARVLDEGGKALLAQRKEMWKQVRALQERVDAMGWQMPQSILTDMLFWHYTSASRSLQDANQVLDLWEQAQPLYDQLGWQPGDEVQRRFERGDNWNSTLWAARRYLKLAKEAVAVQQALAQGGDWDEATAAQARALLEQASEELSQIGGLTRALERVSQARALLGLPEE